MLDTLFFNNAKTQQHIIVTFYRYSNLKKTVHKQGDKVVDLK